MAGAAAGRPAAVSHSKPGIGLRRERKRGFGVSGCSATPAGTPTCRADLRDVLAWQASEVGELLDMSVAAVNSALQRARATMRDLPYAYRSGETVPAADEQIASLLAQYVQAWETADVSRLATLLREDALMTMPPIPAWYQGRAHIQQFLQSYLFAGSTAGTFRMVPTRANGCPAFGAYQLGDDGVYRPGALQVLELDGNCIGTLHAFLPLDDRLFARFGLALTM